MTTPLDPSWTAALLRQRETGMGWQLVELDLDGTRALALVVDASRATGAIGVLPDAGIGALQGHVENASYRVLSSGELRRSGLLGAFGDDPAPSECGDSFAMSHVWRFSRDEDPRVLANGSLSAGSMVCAYREGFEGTESARDAMRQFGIPGDEPPIVRREIRLEKHPVKWGAAPGLGALPGGGEVGVLLGASPPGSIIRRVEVPEGY